MIVITNKTELLLVTKLGIIEVLCWYFNSKLALILF